MNKDLHNNMDPIPELKTTAFLNKLQPPSTVLKPVIPSGTTFTGSWRNVNTKCQFERVDPFVERSSDEIMEIAIPTFTEWKETEERANIMHDSTDMPDTTFKRGSVNFFYHTQEYLPPKNAIFNLNCKYCDKKFATIWNLEDHLQQLHTNHHLLRCRFCDKTFCTTGRLYEHVIYHHNKGQFIKDQLLMGVPQKRSNQISKYIGQRDELTWHMNYLKRRILTKKSMLEIQLLNDIKSEIILEKSKLKGSNGQEVIVMGPPIVPLLLQQLKQKLTPLYNVDSKRKRKSKTRAEIEIVEDENNSQEQTDVFNDTNPSKEKNLQGNDEEVIVKMEVDDPKMLQGQCVILNGEKFIIKQEDNVEGSYCLNKLDIHVLNSPINNTIDESEAISKDYECYEGQIFIKRETEDEDNNFSYKTGKEQVNNSNIDESQQISQCHGNEILIKKEIEDENLIFSHTNVEEQVNINNIDDSQGMVECHGNEIIIKEEVEDEDFKLSHSNGEEQVNMNNGDDSQGMVECLGNEIIIKEEVEYEHFEF
ncbi:uncharacterized protein LOC127705063 [Mytilus californianus]|uniref:uncharacterized protein LOC127705063 n=1 Tax=Mytilus californianus TaxID=6549 RepID=UPI002246A7ED|nr:uncharacterized protein LOC127705063 [Mytilus californianus]